MINMNSKNKLILLAVFCYILIFTYGCSGSAGIKHFTRSNVDTGRIKKVAVLPLDNFTNNPYSHEKIKGLVNMELLSRGIEVAEPGEIISALQELKAAPGKLTPETIQNIGEALKVDTVITGSVSAFEIIRGMSVSYPEVTVNLMMYDAATGSMIWSVWHTAGGADFWTRHFGAEGATLEETSRKVIKEAFDTLF